MLGEDAATLRIRLNKILHNFVKVITLHLDTSEKRFYVYFKNSKYGYVESVNGHEFYSEINYHPEYIARVAIAEASIVPFVNPDGYVLAE